MTTEQPEALRLANELDAEFAQGRISNHTGRKAATELRRQHARIAELEAQLESIAASAGSEPAPVRDEELAELLDLLTNKTAFPTYYFNHKSLYECCDCASEHEDYAEIEHADTCASNKAFADRKKIAELIATLRNRAARAPADSVLEDAARYRLVRRGQHWSVINGIGDALRGEELDAAVAAARKQGANHD